MATKNFRSTVLEPTSEFAHGDKLRFTALSSINQVFKRSFSEVTIGVDGVYDIDLQYGKYRIDYKPYEGIWALFANVEVGAETTATTLQDLAMTSSPVTDDTILALQAILAETKVNAENAEKSSSDSIAAAAEAAQDRDEIEDMMLRAMTTADVEAIREDNKNLFPASCVVEWGVTGSEPVNSLRGGLNCIDESDTLLIDGKYHIAGLTFEIPTNSKVIFPESPNGTVTYNKSNGVVTQHATSTAAFSAANADVNAEVVIDRVDLNCLECYLRAVTEADPFIYPNGDIHSQSVSMAGVATTLDNVRPDSYFANFTGQADVIRGKGVNWFTATNAEKLKILSESNEHGHLHCDPATSEWRQWCLRKRTVAGAGNGDWLNTDAVNGANDNLAFQDLSATFVAAQGIRDVGGYYAGTDGQAVYYANTHASKMSDERGAFKAGLGGNISTSSAINGECYLYVVSTHPRINKAAYHPSHNGMGGKKFTGALDWHQTNLGTSLQATIANSDTAIESGRPDNKVYNKIYPSGQGGTIDHRMTAYETGTAEVMESVLSEVYAGTYRGKQYLTRVATKYNDKIATCTKIGNATYGSDNAGGTLSFPSSGGDGARNWGGEKNVAWYACGDNGNALILNRHLRVAGSDFIFTTHASGMAYLYGTENEAEKFNELFPNGTVLTFMALQETDIPVSGDFTQMDVVGDISNILATTQLSDGWIGGYIPTVPNGTNQSFPLTRKSISPSCVVTSTTDTGATWAKNPISGINQNLNNRTFSADTSLVDIADYTAFAKQTKVSTVKPILNGSGGKSEVWSNSSHENAIFSESVIGKVTTGSQGNARHAVLETSISSDSKFDASNLTIHSGISLTAPDNNSPAVKVLPYQSENNQQTTICFAVTELKYTDSSWGDDCTVHFVDGVSTLIDTNGETVLCAAHELSLPIGYTKKG